MHTCERKESEEDPCGQRSIHEGRGGRDMLAVPASFLYPVCFFESEQEVYAFSHQNVPDRVRSMEGAREGTYDNEGNKQKCLERSCVQYVRTDTTAKSPS